VIEQLICQWSSFPLGPSAKKNSQA